MDPITETQVDVGAFDGGQSYIGTEWADWVEDRGRAAMNWLGKASQDQEGIGDDILRAGGKVLQGVGRAAELPGVKQGLQVLDAASYYSGKAGGAVAKSVGVDPRIGGVIGNVFGEAVTGFGAKKALQIGKYVKRGDAFDDLVRAAAPEGSTYRMMLDTGGGVVSPKKALEDFKKLPENIRNIQIDRKNKGEKAFLK